MDQEALEVLRMVKDGTLTPEQGSQMLEALKNPATAVATVPGQKPKFVRVNIDVHEQEGDAVKVNCNLPIALADLALKMGQFAKITRNGETIELGDYLKQLGGVDIAAVLQMVKDGAEGKLVDIQVNEAGDGDKVKVEVIVD